jgi:hypothetical protein
MYYVYQQLSWNLFCSRGHEEGRCKRIPLQYLIVHSIARHVFGLLKYMELHHSPQAVLTVAHHPSSPNMASVNLMYLGSSESFIDRGHVQVPSGPREASSQHRVVLSIDITVYSLHDFESPLKNCIIFTKTGGCVLSRHSWEYASPSAAVQLHGQACAVVASPTKRRTISFIEDIMVKARSEMRWYEIMRVCVRYAFYGTQSLVLQNCPIVHSTTGGGKYQRE